MYFEMVNNALDSIRNLFAVITAFPIKTKRSLRQITTETTNGGRILKQRSGFERRKGDRRLSSPQQRLRYGFWKAYYREKDAERTQFVTVAFYTQTLFYDILQREAIKYHYYDRGSQLEVSCETALNGALEYIWSNPDHVKDLASEHAAGQKQAQHLINAIAERLCSVWEVRMKETRRSGDRRAVSFAQSGLKSLRNVA